MRQIFYYSIFLLYITLTYSSCKQKAEKEPKKIAVIVSTLNNPWFVFLARNAAAKASELGYESKIFNSQNNTALEANNFENALALGYDAILFNPTDFNGSVTNVSRAKAAGVPVFCMDREVNSDAATSQILSDSYSGCVKIGKYFVKQLNKSGKYVELMGLLGDNNSWIRSKGFHEVVDHYPDLKMVAQQSADFDRYKAMEVVESLLQAHNDINAIFCGNDAMAMGAYQALVAAGKNKETKVFGFDGTADVINAISNGKISATGMQFPITMAHKAAEFAVDYFKGRRNFPKTVLVDVELVTQNNVKNYIAYGKKDQQ